MDLYILFIIRQDFQDLWDFFIYSFLKKLKRSIACRK
jgi:hypothetical protein